LFLGAVVADVSPVPYNQCQLYVGGKMDLQLDELEALMRETLAQNGGNWELTLDRCRRLGLPEASIEKAEKKIRDEMIITYGPPNMPGWVSTRYRWYSGPIPPSPRWNFFKSKIEADPDWNEEGLARIDLSSTQILGQVVPPLLKHEHIKPVISHANELTVSPPIGDSGASMPGEATRNLGNSGRGLVLGHVQSGKTTSFMSLIAKGVDSGYKLVIVLSGVTNNLRSQTQIALMQKLAPENSTHWHWVTTEESDFKVVGNNANNILQGQVVIAVVKKNASRLRALVRWLESASPEIRNKVPMLLIDDEADQASINTAQNRNRQTAINTLIKKLLDPQLMQTNSYVGYTATPFANFLTDPNLADDIYPRDFIYPLSKGDGYFGAEELFGRMPVDEDDQAQAAGLDILRFVPNDEVSALGVAANSQSPNPATLPNQLHKSLTWFVIASAVRYLREDKNVWTSMLIHTSGRIASHKAMKDCVDKDFIKRWNEDFGNFLLFAETLWKTENTIVYQDNWQPDWEEIVPAIRQVWASLKVITDNYLSTDRLNYNSEPFPVIAVGGNTLSRGLVLRGLLSTYFLRTAKGYDVLLQMGRWFGYRKNYEDLQRIWMPKELGEWFRFLAMIEVEIRQQIDSLQSDDVTPLDLPVLIRSHPKMQVTGKGGLGVKREIGFSSKRIETILFPENDQAWLERNLSIGKQFVKDLISKYEKSEDPTRHVPVFNRVHVSDVIGFLQKYEFSAEANVVLRDPILNYIKKVNNLEQPELKEWDVYVFSTQNPSREQSFEFTDGFSVGRVKRSKLRSGAEVANIHHLANAFDVSIGISAAFSDEASALMQGKILEFKKWQQLRAKAGLGSRGLLGLYVVDKDSPAGLATKNREALAAEEHFLGISIFFPASKSALARVDYIGPPPFVVEVVEEDSDAELSEADANDAVEAGDVQ
jgi:hypothetical protein